MISDERKPRCMIHFRGDQLADADVQDQKVLIEKLEAEKSLLQRKQEELDGTKEVNERLIRELFIREQDCNRKHHALQQLVEFGAEAHKKELGGLKAQLQEGRASWTDEVGRLPFT